MTDTKLDITQYIAVLQTYIDSKNLDIDKDDKVSEEYYKIIPHNIFNIGIISPENFINKATEIIKNDITLNVKFNNLDEKSKQDIIAEFIPIVYNKVSTSVNDMNNKILIYLNDIENFEKKINRLKEFTNLGFDILNVYVEYKRNPKISSSNIIEVQPSSGDTANQSAKKAPEVLNSSEDDARRAKKELDEVLLNSGGKAKKTKTKNEKAKNEKVKSDKVKKSTVKNDKVKNEKIKKNALK
jgi:hypothetical protein